MSIILGVFTIGITLLLCGLILWANMMQPAPQASNQMSPLPILLVGLVLGACLIASHWMHIKW